MKQLGLLLGFVLMVLYVKYEIDLGMVEERTGKETAAALQLSRLEAELSVLRASLQACRTEKSNSSQYAPIYVITPTHRRPVQLAELTRLRAVFLLVPNIHWILVEDAASKSDVVAEFLSSNSLPFTHLCVATPEAMKLKSKDPHWSKPRGVQQRNRGIQWLRDNRGEETGGVVYFADDDNTYTPELFEAIRSTKKVSVFPVALVGGLLIEKPESSPEGRLTGWSVQWGRDRPYATDMAGFAVNLGYLLSKPKAQFLDRVKIGYLESEFMKELVGGEGWEAMEVKGTSGKVMVWHTRAEKVNLNMEEKFRRRTGHSSDRGLTV